MSHNVSYTYYATIPTRILKKAGEISSVTAFDVFIVKNCTFYQCNYNNASLCKSNSANCRILRDITAFHHTLPHFTTLIFSL